MAKIIRIIARPTGARYAHHMHKILDKSCIRPTRPTTMVFLAPSVTRVPVKVISRKPAPLHFHEIMSHYGDMTIGVTEVLDNAIAAGIPMVTISHQ